MNPARLLHCIAAASALFGAAAQAQVSLAPVGPTEVTWGQALDLRATYSIPCPGGPAPTVSLRASGTLIEARTATLAPCSGGTATGQDVFSSPGDLPFGSYAMIASLSSPALSSQAFIIRINPQFSFVIPGGQGVLTTGLSPRGAASTCPAISAVLTDRAHLLVPVPPPNMRFPYEHVTYFAANCSYNAGASGTHSQRALIEFPDNIPADAELWLHSVRQVPNWQRVPATFTGRQAAFVITGGVGGDNTIGATAALAVPQPTSLDFPLQDLWWAGADSPGWGLNIAKNEQRLFSTLFIYDSAGKPQWVVMPSGTWDPVHNVYYGDLFIPAGSAYSAYVPERFDMGDPVGKGSLSFITEDDGYFDYVIRDTPGGQRIQRYKFAPRGTATPLYGGMWWGGAGQDGWGVSIQQQGQTLFATWYTYGADGKVTWFYMPGGSWTSATAYTGTLYRTTAGPWAGGTYNPASLKVFPVGTLRLDFTSPNAATMTSTVDGATLARPLLRFAF
jgi:hypothetical protein